MERKSFLKSLFGIIAAPSILSEVDFTKKTMGSSVTEYKHFETGALISDLQILVPKYYKQFLQKYESENYLSFIDYHSPQIK